jgi:hypothetical protein
MFEYFKPFASVYFRPSPEWRGNYIHLMADHRLSIQFQSSIQVRGRFFSTTNYMLHSPPNHALELAGKFSTSLSELARSSADDYRGSRFPLLSSPSPPDGQIVWNGIERLMTVKTNPFCLCCFGDSKSKYFSLHLRQAVLFCCSHSIITHH